MKLKSIAAAVALACGAMLTVHAQAAQVSYDSTDQGAAMGIGVGGLFLSVWDQTSASSVFMDLGKTTSDFVNNNASMMGYSRQSDILKNFLVTAINAGDTLEWNVGGIANGNPGAGTTFGALLTYKPGTAISDSANTYTGLYGGVLDAGTYIKNADANLLSSAAGITTDGTTVSGADSALGGGAYPATYGHNLSGGVGFNDSGSIGDALYMSLIQLTPDFSATTHQVFEQGSWKLNAATGTLTYSAVSAVPVPAAVWLFGSALVGLTGISRRRKSV